MIRSFLNKWLSQRSVPENRGAWGERVAEKFLMRERKMSVVARNWRNPRDRREELDLVMREGPVLVFVEVKTRAEQALVPGYYAVDRKKRRILQRGIRAYLRGLKEVPLTHRLDVVEIAGSSAAGAGEPRVRHFTNVSLRPRQ